MTILFLVRLFYPHGGGVERHVLEVGKRLIEKGHKVIVVSEEVPQAYGVGYHSKARSAKVAGSVSGIEAYRIKIGGSEWLKKFRIWWWLFIHKKLIEQADIVHAHDVFFWYFPFRLLYPAKKVYTTFHGWETTFPLAKKSIFVRKMSEKLSFGNICVGNYIKKWYGTKPTYVTYGGVDITKNSKLKIQNDPLRSGANKSKLKIIFIGRFEKDIGVKTYIEVLDLLKKRNVELEFKAYGEGPLQNDLQKYGKIRTFSTQKVEKALQGANAVFVSSYLSIFMAMAQKRLVFSVYNNPLKHDYLAMAPFAKWIAIANSPEKLVEKMLYFNRHTKEKTVMLEGAYNWVRIQTWAEVVALYLKLWK